MIRTSLSSMAWMLCLTCGNVRQRGQMESVTTTASRATTTAVRDCTEQLASARAFAISFSTPLIYAQSWLVREHGLRTSD